MLEFMKEAGPYIALANVAITALLLPAAKTLTTILVRLTALEVKADHLHECVESLKKEK
jgi:hypothetical protein